MPALANIAAAPHGATIQIGVLETTRDPIGRVDQRFASNPGQSASCWRLARASSRQSPAATSYEVGVAGNLSQFGSRPWATAQGRRTDGLIGPTAFYSATTLTITATGGTFSAGQVRLSICYLLANPSAA